MKTITTTKSCPQYSTIFIAILGVFIGSSSSLVAQPSELIPVPSEAAGVAGFDHHFPPAFASAAPRDVLTQHNDNHRTGAYLAETYLSPANVGPGKFGRLYTRHVVGSQLAQILYVHGVKTSPKILVKNGEPKVEKNLFYVATQQNWVYAFDADNVNPDPNTPPVWSRQLAQPDSTTQHCGEQAGPVGITSTPVIDLQTSIIYIASRHADGFTYLHGLYLGTGKDAHPPIKVMAEDPVSHIHFDTTCQRNRPGLLLLNGVIYLAFGCFTCDAGPYHGWVIGYRATDFHQEGIFCTSAGERGAGIWQSGNGLAADPGGCIYLETANDFKDTPSKLGDSFLRLHESSGHLNLIGVYTPPNATMLRDGPANYPAWFKGDTDLGSSGPVVLPGGKLIGGGKEGRFHVLDMAAMTTQTQHQADQNWIAFINTWHNNKTEPLFTSPQGIALVNNSEAAHNAGFVNSAVYIPPNDYQDSELTGPNIHSGPIFWQRDEQNGYIYCMPEKDFVRAFQYDLRTLKVTEKSAFESSVRCPDGMPGGALSLSANGGKNGIVWASFPLSDGQWNAVNGQFMAFDATNLKLLYKDAEPTMYTKFCPPTVADGLVFRPTSADQIVVYGALHRRSDIVKLSNARVLFDTAKIPDLPQKLGITEKYVNYGGMRGQLGKPIGEEIKLKDSLGGRVQRFAGQKIIGVACQMPPIRSESIYNEDKMGNMQIKLPIETAIYWSSKTGAHIVRGDFLSLYEKLGAEKSKLGYPITDELPLPDGKSAVVEFEHGYIKSSPEKPAVEYFEKFVMPTEAL